MLFKRSIYDFANFNPRPGTIGTHTHEGDEWDGQTHNPDGTIYMTTVGGTTINTSTTSTGTANPPVYQFDDEKRERAVGKLHAKLAQTYGRERSLTTSASAYSDAQVRSAWKEVAADFGGEAIAAITINWGSMPLVSVVNREMDDEWWQVWDTVDITSDAQRAEAGNRLTEANEYGIDRVGSATMNALLEEARLIYLADKPRLPDLKWVDVLKQVAGTERVTTRDGETVKVVDIIGEAFSIAPGIPDEAYEFYLPGVAEAYSQLIDTSKRSKAAGAAFTEADYLAIRDNPGSNLSAEAKAQLDTFVLRREGDMPLDDPTRDPYLVSGDEGGPTVWYELSGIGGYTPTDGRTIFSTGTGGTGGETPMTEYQRLSIAIEQDGMALSEAEFEFTQFMGNWNMENAEKLASFEREKFIYTREEDARKRRLTADIGELNAQVAVSRDTDQARLAAFPYALPDVPGNEYVPGFGPSGAMQTLGAFSGTVTPTVSREQVVVPFDAGAIGRQAIENFHASQGAA